MKNKINAIIVTSQRGNLDSLCECFFIFIQSIININLFFTCHLFYNAFPELLFVKHEI
jgi:hypothetical protein